MTDIYFTYINEKIARFYFEEKLLVLPEEMQRKIKGFRKWKDAHASLYGKLLLLEGLNRFGISTNLNDLKFTQYGKPYLESVSVCFNISHSGNYVICAMSDEVNSVGVDIEQIKPIDIYEFRSIWTDKEWERIVDGKERLFYEFWTRKEAIVKAHGQGVGLGLEKIDVSSSITSLDDCTYYLKTFDFGAKYSMHLAATTDLQHIDLEKLSFQ